MKKYHPNIHLEVEILDYYESLDYNKISAELAIIPVVIENDQEITKYPETYKFVPMFECKTFIWVSKKSALASKKFLDYSELEKIPLILIPEIDDHIKDEMVNNGCVISGDSISIHGSNIHLLESLVENNLGGRLDLLMNDQSMFNFLNSNDKLKKVFLNYQREYSHRVFVGYLKKECKNSATCSLIVNYLNKNMK